MNLARLHNGKHYNALPTTLAGKEATAIYGKFVNYFTPTNDWAEIDCIIKESGAVFEVTKAPFECTFPLYADGEAFFNNNNRFDVSNKTLIDCASLGMMMRDGDASHVQGRPFDINSNGRMDAVLYPQSLPNVGADTIYHVKHGKVPQLQHLTRWPASNLPTGEVQVASMRKYIDGASNAIELSPRIIPSRITGDDRQRQWVDECKVVLQGTDSIDASQGVCVKPTGQVLRRGNGIRKTKAWYYVGGPLPRKIEYEISATLKREELGSDWYVITKTIPAYIFDEARVIGADVYTDATTSFYPNEDGDPDPTSVDGDTRQLSATWSGRRGGIGDASADDAAFNAIGNAGTGLYRAITLLDTSTISPDVVSSGSFDFWPANDFGNRNYGLIQTNPASNIALVPGDFNAPTADGYTEGASRINLTAGQYNSFTLDATGIGFVNTSDITKLGNRVDVDLDNVDPGTNNYYTNAYTVEDPGLTRSPKVVAVHSLAGPTGHYYYSHLM